MVDVAAHAVLKLLELPGGGSFGLITLDNGVGRPATITPANLQELSDALDEALGAAVLGIGVTGVDRVFCAGAELPIFTQVTDRDQALGLGQLGHRVLGRLGELPVPTFAFINGAALGGGLEIALNCTFRTVTATAAPLGLPEVSLGILPAWGGAWLLPNLIGIDTAVQVIVEAPLSGRTFTGKEFARWDPHTVVLESKDFLDRSLAWAAQVLRGELTIQRQEPDRNGPRWQAAIDRGRALVESRLHGATPAPYRALDLLAQARTATRDEGFGAEDEALADLLMTDDNRAALYASAITRSRAKKPAGAPDASLARPLHSVGIVGAGLMARQLAMLFASKLRIPVVLTDIDQERVDAGLEWITAQATQQLEKGRLSADDFAWLSTSVTGAVDKEALSGADLVIEAIVEDLAIKTTMLTDLEPLLSQECVIATNTSSLPVSKMAAALQHPHRFVGMHFFNPVSRMQLLEIIPAATTDEQTLATAFVVGKQLGKSCVLVQDAPGFAVNRLLSRMYAELMSTIDEGTPPLVADQALNPLGLPMSPFALLALIGPAVQLHVNETLAEVWPERFPVSTNLRAIVASGARTIIDPDDPSRLAPQVQAALHQANLPSNADQVLRRVRDALADEAWRMLDEHVVMQPEDLDTAMLLGAGWPAHLGGITPWLDRTNLSASERRFHAPGVASLP
jgi:3-hydroxyacyl-CoA dehydrogenase/enoyl-CoA hydratase/carnithine racemase